MTMRTWALLLCCVLFSAPALARDESLYQLKMPLRDASGTTVGLDVFRGRPVLVSMFYGTCPAACPMLVERIRAVEALLDPATREDVRVLLVSFDAARDTPQLLTALARAHGVDEPGWKLTAASDADARTLAAVLGVRYRHLPGGEFEHNARLVLVEPDGHIGAAVDAFETPPDQLAALVTKAAAPRR
jgi:protein SCO1/2